MTSDAKAVARWAGPALVAAALIALIGEAIVAAAWDQRPYSYVEDYVNFLGSRFTGEFRGIVISSPLWWLMSIAWIAAGILVGVASVALGRRLTGWRRRTVPALGAAQAVALILFAVFPLGPDRLTDGTLPLYLIGAFLSIIAGNALAIVTGLAGRPLGFPRWLAVTSVVAGVVGLLNIPLTYGWVPTGLAERISLYSFLAWALITGLSLLTSRHHN
ncbi:DUF998 domain-containing protein [Actinoplanes sp. NBRC 103695]|uniref:DUF998 domain-containing protein n=1 Tax=Actinoplanes sp. NBRC 103695 TaxID=3032202 RepID=UPI0024A19020|nr:DUF998 domain-containing protein [Actinoplanes sp. NBRC 103695]GLY93220.1 hypothetical protein Acsp02_04760 [Actinoplanes sp. NBRC 103695]